MMKKILLIFSSVFICSAAQQKECVLVTGASSGIGEALSRELVHKGYKVIGIARSFDKLKVMEQELGSNFIPFVCDVSKKEDVKEISDQILERQFIPKILFLNAGLAGEDATEDKDVLDSSIHEKMMNTNYFGVIWFVENFQKACISNNGAKFIVTSSVNATWAPGIASAYGASKTAISMAFKTLSLRYYNTSLKFGIIYTGPVATKGLKGDMPFTWQPKDMAEYMIAFSKSNKTEGYPSWFYTTITWILNKLPNSVISKII